MADLLQSITTNFVVAGLALFALVLGFFAINYLNRRRQLLHQERMASLIKGLHYAGVARDVFPPKAKADSQDHLLRGLRWLFGGAGASAAMYGYDSLQPVADQAEAVRVALIGIIPGALGLAHLLFSWLCSRRKTTTSAVPGTGYYRAVARRY